MTWSAQVLLDPSEPRAAAAAYTLATVVDGTVSDTRPVNVSAQWTTVPLPPNRLAGTVTSLAVVAAQPVAVGDVLYTVDLRPVVVAVGDVPAFRPLARGDQGADVRQLQTLLRDDQHLRRPPTGNYDAATETAVRAWHRSHKVQSDGRVALGEVLFVPALPPRVVLDPLIQVGSLVSDGTVIGQALASEPDFTLTVADTVDLEALVGSAVDVRSDGDVWPSRIASVRKADDGKVADLEGNPGAVCQAGCDRIPVGEPTLLPADLVVAPTVTGPVVPTAALQTQADRTVIVVLAEGGRQAVTVMGSANGLSVVKGLPVGTKVRLDPTRQR